MIQACGILHNKSHQLDFTASISSQVLIRRGRMEVEHAI